MAFKASLCDSTASAEEGILQRLFPEHWEGCFERYIDGYASGLANCEILFPGMPELLRAMRKRGSTLAVNSGKSAVAVELTLREAGIYDQFAIVLGGSAAGDQKPENLVSIAARLGLERSRLAYVGDSPSDMQAASEASVLRLAPPGAPKPTRHGSPRPRPT